MMEEARLGELEAPGVEWEGVEQVCEQSAVSMGATDEVLSDLMGVGSPAGKRKRGDQLAHAPVRHAL